MLRWVVLAWIVTAFAACSPTRPLSNREESPAVLSEQDRARPSVHPAWERIYAGRDLDDEPIAPVLEAHPVTVVVVFASWCEVCRKELVMLAELHKEEPSIGVVGLNAYEEYGKKSDDARLRKFLEEDASWLRVMRADRDLLKALGGVPKIPSTFVFDAEGNLIAEFQRKDREPPTFEELVNVVQPALTKAR